MPQHTSLLYSRNVTRAFEHLYASQDDSINLEDEINRAALVTYKGQIISEAVKETNHTTPGKDS
jgi:NAD/NADP transhydrogenase alpha subunit